MQLVSDFRHKGMRKRLMGELALLGIKDNLVLQAMNRLQRHFFLQSAFVEYAYKNMAFPIGVEQTISASMTVATQSELLHLQSVMKILEIATGSGYQTAVLFEMVAKVFSVERQNRFMIFPKTYWRK
jgi:protein-L-isoaspartate(D-aspartate) O-methyltransferase